MSETSRLCSVDGGPRDRIVGFETEYGLSYAPPRSQKIYRTGTELVDEISRLHNRTIVPEEYLETGERIYVDIGPHPEYSTAEEVDFLEAGYRLLSGHVKISQGYREAAQILQDRSPSHDPVGAQYFSLTANTADQAGNSWGNHENFLAPRALCPRDYIPVLAAHHVSRIVWSGAGNIRSDRDGNDYHFELSEKAEHIWDVANDSTTRCRPLVNLRDEPLADEQKYRRIHIVCGESVFSPFTNGLRLASGSILLRASELGVNFDDLLPENPVRAIREISYDPTLKRTIRLERGSMTGIQHQRELAQRAIRAAEQADYITPQEKYWGDRWLQQLDKLEADPSSCVRETDWMVKKHWIEKELGAKRNRGMTDAEAAFALSVKYHALLPGEGLGMKLLRKGWLTDSPSEDVLNNGLPLPETRAKARGRILGRARSELVAPTEWDIMSVRGDSGCLTTYFLDDPYETDEGNARQIVMGPVPYK